MKFLGADTETTEVKLASFDAAELTWKDIHKVNDDIVLQVSNITTQYYRVVNNSTVKNCVIMWKNIDHLTVSSGYGSIPPVTNGEALEYNFLKPASNSTVSQLTFCCYTDYEVFRVEVMCIKNTNGGIRVMSALTKGYSAIGYITNS